jgi:hypothetical protein
MESLDLLARGSPSVACTSEEMGWWIECWTPRQGFGKLTQGERLQSHTPLRRHMGTVMRKCPCMESVWFDIRTTLHPRLPSMLEFKMLLIKPWHLFIKNFEISIVSDLVKRRSMCRKLRIFKHGRGFMSKKSKHYKLWAPPRRQSSEACDDSYGKLMKMLIIIKMTWPWTIMMWMTTIIPKKTSWV